MKILTFLLTLSLLAFLPDSSNAASAQEIDAKVNQALKEFYHHSPAGKELASKAAGVLVFPDVIKAGIGIGGEYGEGALRVGGKTVAYYNVASASVGFQLGAQIKSEVLLFMSREALDKFRHQPKTSLTLAIPAASWSASSRVLNSANEARAVAGTPNRSITGCAQ